MKYINLTANDGSIVRASKIAMGSTMKMEMLTTKEKHYLYDCFVDHGGNCIDTARYYSSGKAEIMLGEYLEARKNRNHLIISTKGGHPTDSFPMKNRLSRKDILSDLETSLKLLGTDYVDIYWIHKDDPEYPIEELVETCNDIVRQGKARIIGCSNFLSDRIEAARKYAFSNNLACFSLSQIQWSLASTADRFFAQYGSIVMTPERYDFYREQNIGVFAFSSQAQGFFAKVANKGLQSLPTHMIEQFGSEQNMMRLEKLKYFCKEKDCSVSAASLAYLINNKLPCVAIIGARTEEMLNDSLKAVDVMMSSDEADELYAVE